MIVASSSKHQLLSASQTVRNIRKHRRADGKTQPAPACCYARFALWKLCARQQSRGQTTPKASIVQKVASPIRRLIQLFLMAATSFMLSTILAKKALTPLQACSSDLALITFVENIAPLPTQSHLCFPTHSFAGKYLDFHSRLRWPFPYHRATNSLVWS